MKPLNKLAPLAIAALLLAGCDGGATNGNTQSDETSTSAADNNQSTPELAQTPDMFNKGYGGDSHMRDPGRVVGIIRDGESGTLTFTYNVDGTFCKVGGGLSTSDNSPITGVVKDPGGTIVATAESVLGRWDDETGTCGISVWSDYSTPVTVMDFYTMELTGPNGTTFTGTSNTPLIELQKAG